MPNGVLPALVRRPVVGVVFGYVTVDAGQGELLVRRTGDRLNYELRIGEWRLRLVLATAARHVTAVVYHHRGNLKWELIRKVLNV